MTLRNIRLVTAALLTCLLALVSACGGGTSAPAPDTGDSQQRITAEWLAQQPGTTAGDFSLHLLDADNQPLPWRGLTVSAEGGELAIDASGDPPVDANIYVVYPAERLAFASAELTRQRASDYLIIAAPGRYAGVLPVGIARVGATRERALQRGPLLRIRFAAGRERAASAVSTDPANAPILTLGQAAGDKVELSWEERNLGDYDNNGVVSIADLSPLGKYFLQSVNGDPNLVIVDGDENGELTIADISKIGKNIGTALDGYLVRRTPEAEFTVLRDDIFDATPEAQRKQRLQYTFLAPFVPGTTNTYVVVPIGDGTEGVESNSVSYDAASGNLPPVWDTTEGITSVTPINHGLRLTFSSASDPEGGPVEYVLRYNIDPKVPGGADATEVVLPPAVTAGAAPYTYDVTGLPAGVLYNLRLVARDAQGLVSTNTSMQQGRTPAFGASGDPWPYWRGTLARTAYAPGSATAGPVDFDWSVAVGPGYANLHTPLVSSAGWLGVACLNDLQRFSLTDGGVLPGRPFDQFFTWSLANNLAAYSNITNNTVDLYDFALGSLVTLPGFAGEPLLLGDYVVLTNIDKVELYNSLTGEFNWSFPAPGGGDAWRSRPATDGQYLYLASMNGRVVKLDLETGSEVDFFELGATTLNTAAAALDTVRGRLYVSDDDSLYVCLQTSDLNVLHDEPDTGNGSSFAPVVADVQGAPMLVFNTDSFNGVDTDWTVYAHSLEDFTELWHVDGTTAGSGVKNLTADAQRVYAVTDQRLHVIDFNGELRQTFDLGGNVTSDVVPAGDKLFVVAGQQLHRLGAAAVNNPPVWQGTSAKPGGGIRAVSETNGTVTVEWDFATDELGETVRYAVYWRELLPPDFNNPGGGTNVITDIADNGTGSHSFSFIPGTSQRIYVGVRAYDGPWAEPHQIDPNTNSLGITPGWAVEELVTGAQLPPGEIFFMRGATMQDGSLALAYNDTNSTLPTFVFGTTGAWSFESNPLNSWPTNGFDLTMGPGGAQLAICDTDAAVLSRTVPGSWTRDPVLGTTDPELNPQISLARLGPEGALGYNEHVAGGFPTPETHYFSSFFSGGDWQPAQVIDDQNFSGRDLAMTYSQGQPLVAYQLGLNYAPNRLTPSVGLLRMARWDVADSEWDTFIIDPGLDTDGNPFTVESDCGKRIRVVADGDVIHMAWLDLNASTTTPSGQLKYGVFDPVANTFSTTLISTFDLSFQPGSEQYTWGELGLTLSGNQPVISYLVRDNGPSGVQPHYATLWIWDRRSGNWEDTKLSDSELVFPSDREPCFILLDGLQKLHVFFASSTKTFVEGPVADKLVHVYEK